MKMTAFHHIFRWVGIITGWPVQMVYFKRKVYFQNKQVQGRLIKGSALVISNHFNPADFVTNTFLLFPRMLYVVASEHAFKTPGLKVGMKFFGGIETDRNIHGMSFIHQSAALLNKGKLVQIFPEGHNTPDGKIHPFYPSYLVLALMGNAPIIPVISDGNYGIKKRLHVIIGEPIDLRDHFPDGKYTQKDLDRVNEVIYQHVLQLRQLLDEKVAAAHRHRKETD